MARHLLFVAALVVLLSPPAEAQVFPNAFWNRASSCAGSQTSGPGLFARMAQRRASRVHARTQTAGCGGMVSQSSSLNYSPTPTSGCGGTVSYEQYVPSVANYESSAPVMQAAPMCIDGQCPIGQVAPIQSTAPVKSFLYSPNTTSAPEQLFGLSAANDAIEIPNHILAQIATETTFGLETTIPDHVLGQVDSQPIKVAESFKPSLLKAIAAGRKSGKLSVRDAVKLRVACLSPAFVERSHELAVIQVSFSGEASEHVPVDADGVVQVASINWEGLAKFLEAFIPLLITLLKAFGM